MVLAMRAYNSAAAPQFPQLAVKTYAAHPVWKGSTTEEVRFRPLSKKDAVKIFHHARRLERQTATTRRDAFGRVSTQGAIGRLGILVLHALAFDFLNYRTGRLDPCRASIAEKAGCSIRSVARALNRLRDAGILNWVRRCAGRLIDGQFILEQESNAYGIASPASWRGYRPAEDPPAPHREAWGAAPALPALGVQAGDGAGRMVAILEGGGTRLGESIARLGRRR